MAVNEAEILKNLKLGKPRTFQEAANNSINEVITAWLTASIEQSKEILESEGRNATGATGASLRPNITTSGRDMLVQVVADDNAKFLDQGVNGLQNNRGSIYSFRSARPSRNMAKAIQDWIPAKGYSLPQGFKSFEQFSYAIATNVKKRGIEATGFISDVFNDESIDELAKAINEVLKEQFTIVFKGLK